MKSEDPTLSEVVVSSLAKDLKLCKARNEELELLLKEQNCGVCALNQEKLERAETVEAALKFVSTRTTVLERENAELKGMQKRETVSANLNIKEEERDAKLKNEEESKGEDNADLPKEELEELVLHYKTKYKKHKAETARLENLIEELRDEVNKAKEEANKATRKLHEVSEAHEELKKKDINLEAELERARKQSKVGTSQAKQLREHKEFCEYMQFPLCDSRPRYNDLKPVCWPEVDFKEYLSADRRTLSFAEKFVYLLPGTMTWASQQDKHHALGCAPVYVFNKLSSHWERNPRFLSSYGRSIELFFIEDGHVYYSGTYKVHDLRAMHAGFTILKTHHSISFRAIVDGTLYHSSSPRQHLPQHNNQGIPGLKQSTIDQLYKDGVLPVEYIGFQCIGFNMDLQTVLQERFAYTIVPSTKKRKLPVEQPPIQAKGTPNRNPQKKARKVNE